MISPFQSGCFYSSRIPTTCVVTRTGRSRFRVPLADAGWLLRRAARRDQRFLGRVVAGLAALGHLLLGLGIGARHHRRVLLGGESHAVEQHPRVARRDLVARDPAARALDVTVALGDAEARPREAE